MKKLAAFGFAFGMVCTLALGQTNLLEKAQANYLEKREAMEKEKRGALAQLKLKYLIRLEGAATTAANGGNLDRVLAIRNEMGLVEGKPADADAKPNAFVQKAKASYLVKIEEADVRIAEKEATLRKNFVAYLKSLVTRQTQGGQIESALATREVIERVARTPITQGISFGEEEPAPEVGTFKRPPANGLPPLLFPPGNSSISANPGTGVNPATGVPPQLTANTLLYLSFENSPKAGAAHAGDGPRRVRCTVHGKPSYAPGPRGLAMKLTKKEDFIRVTPFVLGREITMAAWVKYDKRPSWGHIIKMGDDNKQAEVALYTNSDGKHIMSAVSGGGRDISTLEAWNTVDVGSWVHVMTTCDKRGTVRLYKNGKIIKQSQRRSGISPHPRRYIQVGRDFDERGQASTNGVYGMVDEVVVLNKALTPEEATDLFKWFGGK